ncbi:MAG TPA: MFS transporter [Gammaproteobacteria bacterium]|nr:MFS transporter [Gammaproteobacteria bacterium]
MSPHTAASASRRIAIMTFFGGIGGGVVFPILPTLGMRLGLSSVMVGLILAANRITRLGFNPVVGSLTDRFGGKWPVTAGLFIEGLGALAYVGALHFAVPAAWFLIGRVIWGVGSSLLFVGALAAVLALSGRDDRGLVTARVRSAISLGVPAGLLVGGVLADIVSADAAFITAAGFSFAAALGALIAIPDARPPQTPTEITPAPGWIAMLRQPMLRAIWSYNALVFFTVSGVLLATLVVLVEQRQLYLPGLGAEGSAGVLMAVLMVWRAAASLGIGRYLARLERRTSLLIPTALVLAAGFAVIGFADSLWLVIVGLLLIGAGTGTLTIPLLALMGDQVPAGRRGRATAIYQVFGDAGGSAGPIIGLSSAVHFGFLPVYLALAGLFVLSLPLGLYLRRAELARTTVS